jgi:hypothetical protein
MDEARCHAKSNDGEEVDGNDSPVDCCHDFFGEGSANA